jgi:acyl-coenzyme A synthetase/AMP-(fatty) acid ligase
VYSTQTDRPTSFPLPATAHPMVRDGWIATPHIPPDYRGPAGRPHTPFAEASLGQPVLDLLHATVMRYPARVATDGSGGTVTFATLWRAICRLADRLEGAPTGPVGILLPSNALYVAAVFACLAARRTLLLLDASYPVERNAEIGAAVGIGLVLAGPEAAVWPGISTLDTTDAFDDAYPIAPLPGVRLDPDAPAFILATSGSTGRPKAIAHSQRTMLNWVRSITNALHVGPDDRVLSISSPSSLGGFTSLLTFPLAGAAMQMIGSMAGGFTDLIETLATRPVTILRAAPSLMRSLVRLPGAAAVLAGLRIVQTYGEPLLKSDVALMRSCLSASCLIRSTYGATEASGMSWFAGEPDNHDPMRVATGTLMPDTEAMILDDDGLPCAADEAGELLIRSRYNALGEWQEGRLVPGRLLPDPSDPAVRVYRTGDIARRSAEGVFVVLGRKDRMIKINGQRVEPAEIEGVLRRSPEVAQAAVIARQNGASTRLLAFIVPTADAGPNLAPRLRTELRLTLPIFMRPSRIILLDRLRLLPGGKVDEAAMLALAETA